MLCREAEEDTGILVTELYTDTGVLEIVDFFPLRSGADLHDDTAATCGELLRMARVLAGVIDVRVTVRLAGQQGAHPGGGGWRLLLPERPDLDLNLDCSHPRSESTTG